MIAVRVALVLGLVGACGGSDEDQILNPPRDQYEEWVKIEPPGVVCGNNSQFKFFANFSEQSDNLVVVFEPGGACWDYDSCTGKGGVLHIDRAGGDIHLASAPNGVHATTGGGEVTIGRADRTVYAQTGGGDITVGPASGSVTATTGAGDVHVILARGSGGARTVKIDAGVGNVLLELPRGVGATFDLETGYTKAYGPKASIRSDVPVDIMVSDDDHWDAREGTPRKYVRASATTGDGKLQLQVRTLNGNIVIRYAK